MAPKLTFALIPGSFTTPSLYQRVTSILTSQNHPSHGIKLLTAGDRTPSPPATMYDDAAYIHSELTQLLDAGSNVVLVMSSYGGIPGTEAVKGLSQSERGEGKTAVVALVYLAALLPLVGKSSNETMTGDEVVEKPTGEDPYMTLDPVWVPKLAFSDLPESEQQHFFTEMTVHSRVSFDNKLTHGGWQYIPATYVFPTEDRIVALPLQRKMVDAVNEQLEDGKKIKEVVFEGSGHVPTLSRPQEVVDVLLKAAEGYL